jgi:hypothetical protein
MKKASEYRLHADECRALAGGMQNDEQRAQLLAMAEQWEVLARDREAIVVRHPELAQPEDT